MADELMFFKENEYNDSLDCYSMVQADLQEVVDAYNTLGFADLTSSDLYKLFTGFEDLMFDKMTAGQPVVIGAFTLNRKKAIEILDKPAGYTNLQNKIAEVTERFKNGGRFLLAENKPFEVGSMTRVFEIDGTGAVAMRADFLAAYPERFKIYAKSDAAKKVFAFAQAVKSAYEANDIKRSGGLNGEGLPGLIKEITHRHGDGSLSIDAERIAGYNNSLYVAQ